MVTDQPTSRMRRYRVPFSAIRQTTRFCTCLKSRRHSCQRLSESHSIATTVSPTSEVGCRFVWSNQYDPRHRGSSSTPPSHGSTTLATRCRLRGLPTNSRARPECVEPTEECSSAFRIHRSYGAHDGLRKTELPCERPQCLIGLGASTGTLRGSPCCPAWQCTSHVPLSIRAATPLGTVNRLCRSPCRRFRRARSRCECYCVAWKSDWGRTEDRQVVPRRYGSQLLGFSTSLDQCADP